MVGGEFYKGVTDMVIENRKAYHDYFVDDTLECGIVLRGNEVKSLRAGMASIKEAYCFIRGNTLVLTGFRISKWETSNVFDIDEMREKVLLAHKSQIRTLYQKVKLAGVTLVPLKIYFKGNNAKVLLGVCRGKHLYDKRATEKVKQMRRDMERSY